MSDTPQTDAEKFRVKDEDHCDSYEVVSVDFARKIERENTKLKEAIRLMRNRVSWNRDAFPDAESQAVANAKINAANLLC